MKKNRDMENRFLVEGEKMVREINQEFPELIDTIYTTQEDVAHLENHVLISDREMKELSTLKTPSSFLAVVRTPNFSPIHPRFILAIDGVQDPGNMGTIIRTADWFQVDEIVCSTDTVDIFNPKVVQATMGSLFHVPIRYTDLKSYLSSADLAIFGALLEGENMYNQPLPYREGILLVGNEGKGIRPELLPFIQHPVLIPRFGRAESLNVSMATGILLAEFSRDRN